MPNSRQLHRASLAVILFGVLLAATAAMRKSVTVDEFQALPSGVAMLQTGDFRYPQGTPPLSQLLPAIPAFLSGMRVEPVEGRYPNWGVAHSFADSHPEQFHFVFLLARMTSCLVLLALFLFTFVLAKRFYGEKGALLCVLCTCLNPNILAHGALVTPDIYLATGVMGFLLALDLYRENATGKNAVYLGVALAFSALSKFTGLLLFPLLPLLLLLGGVRRPAKPTIQAWSLGFFLIHLSYLFQGSLAPAGSYFFQSSLLQQLFSHVPGWLPLALPSAFLHALDGQLSEPPYLAYLLGSFNEKGFFSYYLVALLVKTPVTLLVLAAWALTFRKILPRERSLLVVFLFFFLFFSLARYKNIGLRYLLFLYPVIALWVGRLVQHARQRIQQKVVGAACAVLLAGTIASWPHYLAYFNLPSGGSGFGNRYLIDSNLDWGQDLTTLKDFMVEHNVEEIGLAHFGHVSPSLYGIKFEKLSPAYKGKFLAVSANFLNGRPFFQNGLPEIPGSMEFLESLRKHEPVAVLGYSIYVYEASSVLSAH